MEGSRGVFPLLSLPEPAWAALADALRGQQAGTSEGGADGGHGGALSALRATCRHLRAVTNAHTCHMCIRCDDGMAEALSYIAERFPTATKVEIDCPRCNEQFTACLAALPPGCWPAVEEVCCGNAKLSVPAAARVAQLCPRLRRISIECEADDSGATLAAAFEAIAAVAGTLKALDLSFFNHYRGPEEGRSCDPMDMERMAAALARLSRLRRLDFRWDKHIGHFEAADLLVKVLPALTQLTSLDIEGFATTTTPRLASWPASLREVSLDCYHDPWILGMVAAAPPLVGVTKLHIAGNREREHDPAALALAAHKCPALRELSLACVNLGQPQAALAHLTWLSLEGCSVLGGGGQAPQPLQSLAAAAPQLEVLDLAGWCDHEDIANATVGHTVLQEVQLEFNSDEVNEDEASPDEIWLNAAQQLPALTRLDIG